MNSIELLTCWTTFLLVTAWLGTTGRRDPYWHVIEVDDDLTDLAEAFGVLAPGRDAVDIKLWEEECSG